MIGFALAVAFSVIPISGFAGGWIASGGGSFRLEKNPWFVKNTQVVNYCVMVDEAGVSASVQEIQAAIAESFKYWARELSTKPAMPSAVTRGFTEVATQEFVRQSQCDATTDIAFKIGYETLDQKEREWLQDPTAYIGVSIRKDYDEIQMKGRGIVFISSDRGAHVYRNLGQLVSTAWSKPKLLQYALTHEIGHIMGISHWGMGLMSETFLTSLLNSSGWTFFAGRPILSFTQPLSTAEVCNPDMSDSFVGEFFGLANEKCLRFERNGGSNTDWNAFARAQKESELIPAGQLKITSSLELGLSLKPVIFVYLPDSQTVFRKDEMGFADFLVGALASSGLYQGIFTRPGSHRPYSVQINTDAESLVISGVIQDRIVPVFFHHLPFLKGIVFP